MDEYHMTRRELMADVRGGQVRGRLRLVWMNNFMMNKSILFFKLNFFVLFSYVIKYYHIMFIIIILF